VRLPVGAVAERKPRDMIHTWHLDLGGVRTGRPSFGRSLASHASNQALSILRPTELVEEVTIMKKLTVRRLEPVKCSTVASACGEETV